MIIYIVWGVDSAEGDWFDKAFLTKEKAEAYATERNVPCGRLTETSCYWKVVPTEIE